MDWETSAVHDGRLGLGAGEGGLVILHEGSRSDTVYLITTENRVWFGRCLENRLRILLER